MVSRGNVHLGSGASAAFVMEMNNVRKVLNYQLSLDLIWQSRVVKVAMYIIYPQIQIPIQLNYQLSLDLIWQSRIDKVVVYLVLSKNANSNTIKLESASKIKSLYMIYHKNGRVHIIIVGGLFYMSEVFHLLPKQYRTPSSAPIMMRPSTTAAEAVIDSPIS